MTTPALGSSQITVVRRRLSELTLDPANARKHGTRNLEAIRSSLMRFGQVEPVVVQRSSGRVIGGNARVEVLRELGVEEADVVELDVDDLNATALGIALNRTSELAEWDEPVLAQLLTALEADPDFDHLVTGFSDAEIARLQRDAAVVEDDAPDLPEEAVSRPGDIWVLGDHALAVADCTDRDAVLALMEGRRAACMWTDPPYGVEYVGGTRDALSIQNDTRDALPMLLRGAFSVANEILEPGAPFYIAHPTGPLAYEFETAIREVGWRHHQTLAWVKDALVLGHSDYHLRHEGILYGWTPGAGRSGRGRHEGTRWFGSDAETSVFEIPRPRRSEMHPTMKPVDLVARCLKNSTKRGDLVFEPFSGSGSTLVACQQLGRVCRAVEIDPRYADVTVRRWESLTGLTAVRRPA